MHRAIMYLLGYDNSFKYIYAMKNLIYALVIEYNVAEPYASSLTEDIMGIINNNHPTPINNN